MFLKLPRLQTIFLEIHNSFSAGTAINGVRMINQVKKIVKRFSVAVSLYLYIDKKYRRSLLSRKKNKDIFKDIYVNNSWGNSISVSGPGSNMEETAVVREELPFIISQYGITSILDIPCGDFFWMKEVDLGTVNYIGADLVPDIIANNKKHANQYKSFVQLDVTESDLPAVDLVIVRDCLVHLSFNDISRALRNICKSKSQYLLTTTFHHKVSNVNICTGEWSPLNLQKKPFLLPVPILMINESNPNIEYADKSLGLWRIQDIEQTVYR